MFAPLVFAGGLATQLVLRSKSRQERQNNSTEELVYSCAIVRHGARGPTRKALYLACGETPAQYAARIGDNVIGQETDHPATSAANVWSPEECESLTDVGGEQIFRVGKWFREDYVARHNLETCMPVKMRVSDRPRVVQSAKSFSLGFGEDDINVVPFDTREDADRIFRSWTGKDYNRAVDAMRKGVLFTQYGEAHARELDAIVCSSGNWIKTSSRGCQFNYSTYLNEILECESYAGKHAIKGSLSSKISTRAREHLHEIAKHCFHLRFFGEMSEEYGSAIGGDLLHELEQDAERAQEDKSSRFGVYVGHDYTILALLAAMGLREHPPKITGFGAFAIVQFWKSMSPNGAITRKVMLYSEPFPDFRNPTQLQIQKPFVFEEQQRS